jgi:hypothetical protein
MPAKGFTKKAPKAVNVSQGQQKRESNARRSKERTDALNDIGDIPPIINPARRKACENDLLLFLSTYFPYSTGLSPLGQDQIDAVRRIEVAINENAWVANVMPRGFIKSTLSENSILWAGLYGKRKYALFFAGTAGLAEKGIFSIRQELVTNDLLLEDFPEACYPMIKLEGKPIKAANQTYQGVQTNPIFSKEVLRLANIPGVACSGFIVESYGLLAPPRGARYKDEMGRNVRPDIAVLDDPQTDESATSTTQTDSRLRFTKNSISMMGGHGNAMSLILNATIIANGDMVDQISDPDLADRVGQWQSVRVSMVKKMPDALETHWLKKYAEIRKKYDRNDPRGQIKARIASTEYYRKNKRKMDEGHEVAWNNIALEDHEISALQHAMNIWIDKGPETFASECQNRPVRNVSVTGMEITRETANRISGYDRYVIPASAPNLVVQIDVHDSILYYTAAAVANDFTGFVVDYGTFPEQANPYFTMRTAKQTLMKHYKLKGNSGDTELAVEMGVEDLLTNLMQHPWRNENGDYVPMRCILVDVGYKKTEVVNAIRKSKCAVALMSRGQGIGTKKKPMAQWDLTPKSVLKYGPEVNNVRWVLPIKEQVGSILEVQADTYFWMDVMLARMTQTSPVARWELFNGDHNHYIAHAMSQVPEQKTDGGRTVNVWGEPKGDNHWWDTLVGCGLAASLVGCHLPVSSPVPTAPADDYVQEVTSAPLNAESMFTMPDGRPFFITAREYS